MNICVVALGKIGLPLAVQFAAKGNVVIGVDVNAVTVDLVNQGIEPFPGEADLGTRLREVVHDGRLTATTDTASAVSQSEVVVLVVPLFVDDDSNPDFAWMDSATRDVAKGLKPGTLVSYETTLPVGTTRNRYATMLSEISGLTVSEDLFVVFSPERVLTGRVFSDLRRYPKCVGGVDEVSERRGVAFYEAVLDFDDRPELPRANGVWAMGTAEAAEMTKLAETTYRDVNIGLANQFARFASTQGIDIQKVIEACNSQPYSHIHQPGIAVGGHCIPVYPRLYLFNDPDATIVREARAANASMPDYAVSQVKAALGGLAGARIAVLGAAYRGGVKETAFSGVFPVVAAIRSAGAEVAVHDPLFSDEEISAFGWSPYALGQDVDAVIVQTDHAEYRELTPQDVPGARVVFDGRRVLDQDTWRDLLVLTVG